MENLHAYRNRARAIRRTSFKHRRRVFFPSTLNRQCSDLDHRSRPVDSAVKCCGSKIASEWGYTSQFDGLEKLYRRFAIEALVILGFPANNIGGQEPGSNKEIAQFCKVNYGISLR